MIYRFVVRVGLVVCWVALTLALCTVLWAVKFSGTQFVVFSVPKEEWLL